LDTVQPSASTLPPMRPWSSIPSAKPKRLNIGEV
jgi:hypothetical protein